MKRKYLKERIVKKCTFLTGVARLASRTDAPAGHSVTGGVAAVAGQTTALAIAL